MIKIKQKHNLDFYEKEKEINKLKEKIISLKKGKNNINMNNFDDKKSKIINISKESFNLSTEKFRYFPLKIIKRKKNSDIKNILFFNNSQITKEKIMANSVSLSVNNYNNSEYNKTMLKKKKELNNLFNKQKTNITFNLNNINQEKIKNKQNFEESLKILDIKINSFTKRNKKDKKIKINQRAKSCIRRDISSNESNSLRNFVKKNLNKSSINNYINLVPMNITLKKFKKSYIFKLKKKQRK